MAGSPNAVALRAGAFRRFPANAGPQREWGRLRSPRARPRPHRGRGDCALRFPIAMDSPTKATTWLLRGFEYYRAQHIAAVAGLALALRELHSIDGNEQLRPQADLRTASRRRFRRTERRLKVAFCATASSVAFSRLFRYSNEYEKFLETRGQESQSEPLATAA
jgi:hypothetical protein